MISRENYMDVKRFLRFQGEMKQSDPYTVKGYYSRLLPLMTWAQENPFNRAPIIRPTFPSFLEGLVTRDNNQIGSAHFTGICKTARAFFMWAREEFPGRYRGLDRNWIVSIRPPRARREQAEIHKREIFTVEEVIKLAHCPAEVWSEQRTRAAAAFLFLSGMRITAFVSLPIGCVDLETMQVQQLPERGVLTKNRKAAITTLLQIPSLLEVVRDWDRIVRKELGEQFYWYTHLTPDGELSHIPPNKAVLQSRRFTLTGELQRLCATAGVEYKSAHKFRHGHAVYALKHCKTMAEFKSVSQNLMHSTIGITDGIYGNLVQDDVHKTIMGLAGEDVLPVENYPELQAAFEAMMKKFLGGK
jgi:integrase